MFSSLSIDKYTSELELFRLLASIIIPFLRFPRGIFAVIVDVLERLYLAGFPLLQLFVTLFPLLTQRRAPAQASLEDGSSDGASAMEFLPLMLTSVYCAVGLVWAFIRLSFVYLTRKD